MDFIEIQPTVQCGHLTFPWSVISIYILASALGFIKSPKRIGSFTTTSDDEIYREGVIVIVG